MPLFFFASGFVFAAKSSPDFSYRTFIWKKIKRLMIPYVSTSLVVICLKLVTQQVATVDNPVSPASFYRLFYGPEAGYFLWFIWALFLMYAVAPASRNKIVRWSLLAVSILLHFLPPLLKNNICCLNEFQRMFVYFNLGSVGFAYRDCLKKFLNPLIWTAAFAASYCLVKVLGSPVWLDILPAICGVAFIMAVASKLERHPSSGIVKMLLPIYSSSYIIYLFHTTFNGFARLALTKVPALLDTSDSLCFSIGAVIVVTCGIVCPMLLNRFILSKTKVTRFLFGI